MKKFLLLAFAMIGFAISSASAQIVESSRFFDNMSVSLKGGTVTPMKNAAFWGDMRGVVGIELQKNITPVWGIGVESQWSVNTSSWAQKGFMHSTTAFDHQLLGVYNTINLMNLFGGYKGTPRVFEINVNAGVGWLHAYMNNHKELYDLLGASTFNSWYTKVGPDFNFNLGKAKAWTLSLKPAFIYNMNYPGSTGYDIRHGYFEILAGVTYHFKNSNKSHSFKVHDDTDYLYALVLLEDDNRHLAERVAYLEENPLVVEKIVQVTNEVAVVEEPGITAISNAIGFDLNSSKIPTTAYASLQNIAELLKEEPELKLNILGYASAAEGTQEYNLILSQHRGDNVKTVLVEKFGIDSNRINVIAKGDTIQPYPNNNTWNRCVLFEPVE